MRRLRAALGAVGRGLLAGWGLVGFGVRELEFYGGLALYGAGFGRWPAVGLILAAHAWLGPVLAALMRRKES
jgi:hypothetical protein